MKFVSAEEAVQHVKSGDRVFLHGAAATPANLLDALVARARTLEQVEVVHMHADGPAPHVPIVALPSTARPGTVSRIVATLAESAGVTTTRAHVHYIVTEHGVAYLHGKSIRERAEALIGIAHPAFRKNCAPGRSASTTFSAPGGFFWAPPRVNATLVQAGERPGQLERRRRCTDYRTTWFGSTSGTTAKVDFLGAI